MGAFTDYFETAQPTQPAAPQPEGVGDALRKGFNSGVSNAGASLNQLAGLGGEVVGANDFAQGRYAAAKGLRRQAEEEAPEINSLGQIHSVNTGLRYAAGQIGGLAPIAGAAVAGGLATGNPFIGGTLAMAPLAAGDIAERQQEDPSVAGLPAGQRGLRAIGGGLAAGVVQNFGPGMFAGKLASKIGGAEVGALAKQSAGSIIAKNLAEGVGVNAGGSAGGEAITQYATNPDKPLDTGRIGESAATGAAMGLPFGAAGAGAELFKGRIRGGSDAIKTGAGAVSDAAAKAVEGAPKKFGSLADDLSDLVKRGKEKSSELVDKVMSGQPLVDAKSFATEAGQAISDNEKIKAATGWIKEMSEDAGLTPERRQQAAEMAQNATTEAGQIAAAAAKKVYDAGVFAANKVKGLYDSFEAGRNQAKRADVDVDATEVKNPRIGNGDITDVTPIKKSADYSGTNKIIADQLGPLLDKNPGLADRPGDVAKLADTVRIATEKLPNLRLNSDTMFRLIDTLGDQTFSTLKAAYGAVKESNPADAETFFKKLNEVNDLQKRTTKLKDFVGGALTDEAKSQINPQQYGELVNGLMKHARGEFDNPHAGPHELAARSQEFRDVLVQHFGDKADAVSLAIEKEAGIRTKAEKISDADPAGVRREAEDLDGVDYAKRSMGPEFNAETGERLEEGKVDSARFGLTKPDAAGKSHSKLDGAPMLENSQYARQHLLDLKEKYKSPEGEEPKYNVRFEKMAGSEKGHIVVERNGAASEGEFGIGDLDRLKHDTTKYPDSPSRLKVNGHNIDAVKVARIMGEREGFNFESPGTTPSINRTADMFKRGIAQLTDQFGKNIHVPDDAVIGYNDKKPFTWGDAKGLRSDTAENRMSKKGVQDLKTLRENYKGASKKEQAEILESAQKLYDREKNKELASGDNNITEKVSAGNRSQLKGDQQGPRRGEQQPVESTGSTSRAKARDRLRGDHERHIDAIEKKGVPRDRIKAKTDMGDRPFEQRDGNFDEDGNLTKAGAVDLLQGDYHGGIDVNNSSAHDRDRTNYQETRGEGRTAIGKDEQIHRVAATLGEKDITNKSNMDGSAQYVSDKTSGINLKPIIAIAAELRDGKFTSAGSIEVGNRLSALIKNRGLMRESDVAKLARIKPDASAGEIAKIINPIDEKYKDAIVKAAAAESAKVEGAKARLEGKLPPIEREKNPIKFKDGKVVEGTPKPKEMGVEERLQKDKFDDLDSVAKVDKFMKDAYSLYENGADDRAVQTDLNRMFNEGSFASTDLASFYDGLKGGNAELDHQSLLDKLKAGDTPDPKSQAAKKAALLEAASSSDPALIKELSTTDNAAGLQRTVVELPPGKAADAANKRMGELVQDPDTALNLTKKYDESKSGAAKTDTPETRKAVGEYITKVLGNSVKLKFAELTHAGEFERMRLHDIIRLSTTALDPMSTAHHEALHGLFAQLKDAGAHDIVDVLEKAAGSEHVLAQLKEIYKGNDAVLAQLKDPEERAAYMYQHWANDDLKIGLQAKGVLTRIADFVRSVMGIWTNDQRATAILEHFNTGEYAKSGNDAKAMSRNVMGKGRNQALETAKSLSEPLTKLVNAVVATGSGRLRDMDSKAISAIADLIKRNDTDKSGGDRGFIPAARIEATKRRGELAESLSEFSQDQLHQAMEAMQKERSYSGADGAVVRKAQDAIKNHLKQTREYMLKAGVDVGDLGPDYFPRVWDSHYISKHQQEFRDMLEPYIRRGEYKGNADELITNLAVRDGNEFGIDRQKLDFEDVKARPPGMQFSKTRVLDFIKPEDAAMFVNKDLMGTLANYTNQAVRKAEWTRRLGNGKLEELVEQAKGEGATSDQIKQVDTYLRGIDGTLGDKLNPHARRIMGNMIVYQNIRLLPFAAFSSVVDPMGVMVRGGGVKDAWKTFTRGVSEIPESFGRKGGNDRATQMAELVGVVDRAILSGTMGDMYTQGMVGGFAKKANNLFFKYNLMEGLNRSFRIGASEAAVNFIAKHSEGTESRHSQRWIDELGLQAGDVKKTADGRIAVSEAEGLSKEQEGRVHMAINQWVDGAVLRPDAADKPIWMNDPRYALISHLKQFTYSFQKVIIGRVVHEAERGNYAPVMAMASYVPVMLAADFAKGMIQGGGDQPEWKKGWDMTDYMDYAVQRAGLLGVGQFGADVAKDVHRGGLGLGALTGPTIEQFGDAVQLLGGHKQFGPMVLNALPANAVYSHAFGHTDSPDPMFSD